MGGGGTLADAGLQEPAWPSSTRPSPDTRGVLRVMAGLARAEWGALHPDVRMVAVRIADGCPQDNRPCIVAAVRDRLRQLWKYVRDPRTAEFIQAPNVTAWRIRHLGRAWGDCDDLAVFQAAVLTSLGVPARVEATTPKWLPEWGRPRYTHARASALVGPSWQTVDFLNRDVSVLPPIIEEV
jgi:transglutaminase-like putative cysteine protease